MSEDIRGMLKQDHGSYEVTPYYVPPDERPFGAKPISKAGKPGFDIDIYSEQGPDERAPFLNISWYT